MSDELTTRMEDVLEQFRWTPLLNAINRIGIEDVREAALLQIVSGHSFNDPVWDAQTNATILMWCKLLGDKFSDLAKVRQSNPLPVKTIYFSSVDRFDYAECVRWACEQIVNCIDGIVHHEMML